MLKHFYSLSFHFVAAILYLYVFPFGVRDSMWIPEFSYLLFIVFILFYLFIYLFI